MSGSSINNRVFSPSTIEALSKKVNKNQDENISVKEIKNSITDSKGNIDDSKLKSIGITDQEDIKKIKSEYKSFDLDSKIVFQIPKSNDNKIPKDIGPDFKSTEYQNIKEKNTKNFPIAGKTKSPDEIKLTNDNNSKKEFIHEILKNNPKQFKDIENKIKNIKNPENIKDFLIGVINILNKDNIKEQNKSLDIFHGKNPEAISILKNKGDEKKLSDDYVKEVKNFKGIHNIDNSSILNLTESLDHFDNSYFNISESPRTSTKTENHYLKTETKESEIKLRDKILKSEKKNLTPVDLIKSALEVTKGDYHKAVLTLHNSLKSIAYDLRKVEFDTKNNTSFFNDNSTFYMNDKKIGKETFNDDLKIVSKLANLRADPKKNNDKIGSWYHFFGVQTVASRHSSGLANLEISQEHLSRFHNLFGSKTSPIDIEKKNIDNLSLVIFNKINK